MSFSRSCMDELQDAAHHLLVESASQPALEEAHMHEGLTEEPGLTPHRGVGHPPCLNTHMHTCIHACCMLVHAKRQHTK